MMKTNGVHCQQSTRISVTIAMSTEPSQSGGSSPIARIDQSTSPQSGLSSARHITPTTIGVISIGSKQDAADDPGALEIEVEEQRQRHAEHDLEGDGGRHHEGAVHGGVPEHRIGEQCAVVSQARRTSRYRSRRSDR